MVNDWRAFPKRGATGISRNVRPPAQRSVYAGAKVGNTTLDWIAGVLSADQAIKTDLRKLRDRSRALVRDFSYASRFVQSVAENVAGPKGVKLQVRAVTTSGSFKHTLNDEVEDKWARWSEDPTVDGIGAFADVEHLLCESLPQDGCYLVRMVTGFRGNDFRFAIQVLDADQLDHTYNHARGDTRNEVRQGVEVDAWGRPVGYWIWNHHPTDYSRGTRVREFVPADQIVHQFIRRRAGQTMGVPWFAPVLIDERMLQGFQEASVTNARVGATNTFFLKMNPEAASEPGVKALDSDINLEAEPGVGQILPPGYDVAQWNPKYPNAEFDPFRTAILGSLATGLRVSHMTLTGDLSGANYSSMRAGLLPERDAWRLLHGWHTRGFHRRVYRAWLRAGVLAGAIDVAPRDLEKVLRADTWQTRGFPWVDPQADIQARLMEVDAGINTLTNICAEEGRDFEDIIAIRKREIELANEAGVPINLGPMRVTTSTPPDPNAKPQNAGDSNGQDTSDDPAQDDEAGNNRRRQVSLRLARALR